MIKNTTILAKIIIGCFIFGTIVGIITGGNISADGTRPAYDGGGIMQSYGFPEAAMMTRAVNLVLLLIGLIAYKSINRLRRECLEAKES